MALRLKHIILSLLMLTGALFSGVETYAQGKVIINEFMSSTGCAQYIELKNLGPGRENIGCYIIASELGAITIPQNTWLDPGDLYLIAGTKNITNCGTTTSVTVDLDWTKCGCTSPSMTTSTSFFGDRSSQNSMYPLVLFNSAPTLTIVDAVSEGAITKPFVNTNSFTTSTSSCTTRTVNLSTISKTLYEDTGPAPGTNASASRKIDGSCEWNKSANKQTPGFSNTVGGVNVNPIVVSSNYNLNCLGGDSYTATQNISISLTGISQYYLSTAYASDSVFTQNVSITSSTLKTQTSITLTAPTTLKPGYYNYLFEVSPGSTCDQKQLLFQMIDPIMTISPTYSVDCIGGIADFKVTNVGASNTLAPFYFPIGYNLTSSTSSYSSTGTTTIPDVVRISQIPPVGTYTVTLTPASQYACPKTIGFNMNTQPLSVLSANISTTAACDNQSLDGNATISLTNPNLNLYYPINYTINKIVGATSSFVTSGTLTTTTKTFYGLSSGTYSITLDPEADGCVRNSSFNISVSSTPCTLKETLKIFTGKNIGAENEFNIEIDTDELVEEIHLESSMEGTLFNHIGNIPFEKKKGMQKLVYRSPVTQHSFYRLQLHDVLNRLYNSSVIRITNQRGDLGIKAYPNPAGDHITLNKFSSREDGIKVLIMTTSGKIIYEEQFTIRSGSNSLKIPTRNLPKGQYVLSIYDISTGDRQSSTIIK